MGIETAVALAGGGQIISGISNYFNQRSQNRQIRDRNRAAERYTIPLINQGQTPSSLETSLAELLSGWSQRGSTPNEAFNTGQDSLMQLLRSNPLGRTMQGLEGMAATGDPFDTSNMFSTLEHVDARQRSRALADLRAGSSGLGQRFGSSMMRGEEDLVERLLENTSARNAQIQMGAHESAQGRRLQASNQLGGMVGQQADMANTLANLGLGQEQSAQTMMQLLLGGYGQLSGMQAGRQNQSMQALGMLLGLPITQSYNPGTDMGQLGQLLLIMAKLREKDDA
jgi:hypothetical protein